MKKLPVLLFIAVAFLLNACQKEVSYETGGTPSDGLLQSDLSGDCLPKNVMGTYEQGTALSGTSNYLEVTVDVTTPGAYTIYTDTVNGVFFRGTGIFTATGLTVVKLAGSGTPSDDGIYNFIISYRTQSCSIPVTFLPTGAGGPATFTFNCSPAPVPQGTYGAGVPLTASNKVVINVNVTTIGSYNITTTSTNGMIFTGNGAFTSTGPTTIELTGSGTPTAAATNTINVSVGSSTCSFTVTVSGAAVFTVACASTAINGDYVQGQSLTTANTVVLSVNVTTAGAYTLTTSAVNGMVFFASGTLATGAQTITLTGGGVPLAAGTSTINVPVTPSCSFNIDVEPGTIVTIDWKFTEGANTYEGSTDAAEMDNTTQPPATAFVYIGVNTTDELGIGLIDLMGGLQVNESYSTGSLTGNLAIFEFYGTSVEYHADPGITGTSLIVKVTAHNTTTKTISGTFSGTVKSGTAGAGPAKTITNGQFSATYH